MANIVPVTISDALFYKTDPVFQYNEGDQLLVISGITLPASYRVDFSNHIDNYMAYTVTGDASGAVIPPEILANGNTIYAFYVDESGDTVTTQYRIEIPVIRRPMPEDYVPSPSSHGIINQLSEDVSDLKSDLGDLSNLETTDKSSIVAAINEAAQSGGGGLTADVKIALLDCFSHVAWIDAHGQDYYDALESALYPPADLVSISASFNSGGATIYNTDTLDDLKQYLTVTATYSDLHTETVASYLLTGVMAAGTQTITVTYAGKTTTFTVTVVEWVTSISAVYTPSGTVYDTDSLNDLKADLVVTATYADTTSETLSDDDYTLSGSMTAGTNTFTVSYAGKSDSFTVTVIHNPYWAIIPIDRWVEGTSPNDTYDSTYDGYYSRNTARCCLFLTDYVLEAGYTYTFEHDYSGQTNFGGNRWDANCLTAVANHESIGSYDHSDSGWLSSGATYTPDIDRVMHIQWRITKAELISGGMTALFIKREAV